MLTAWTLEISVANKKKIRFGVAISGFYGVNNAKQLKQTLWP